MSSVVRKNRDPSPASRSQDDCGGLSTHDFCAPLQKVEGREKRRGCGAFQQATKH